VGLPVALVRGDEVDAARLHRVEQVSGVIALVGDDAVGKPLGHSFFERGDRERVFRGGRS